MKPVSVLISFLLLALLLVACGDKSATAVLTTVAATSTAKPTPLPKPTQTPTPLPSPTPVQTPTAGLTTVAAIFSPAPRQVTPNPTSCLDFTNNFEKVMEIVPTSLGRQVCLEGQVGNVTDKENEVQLALRLPPPPSPVPADTYFRVIIPATNLDGFDKIALVNLAGKKIRAQGTVRISREGIFTTYYNLVVTDPRQLQELNNNSSKGQ